MVYKCLSAMPSLLAADDTERVRNSHVRAMFRYWSEAVAPCN